MPLGTDEEYVRPTAVAGSFYPSDRDALAAMVSGLLNSAATIPVNGIRAIIAPHAGYTYSGPVAAEACAGLTILKDRINRIVIVGPAHYVSFQGIAAPSTVAFETPLGKMPVDTHAVLQISTLPQVVITDHPHKPEHSLEVEIPFLQAIFGRLPIVPLVVGRASAEEVAQVLRRIWQDDTLVVISTDLSHYHNYNEACWRDQATAEMIERFDEADIGPQDACGYLALRGMLIEAKRRAYRIDRLKIQNSGDTAGDRNRVVGYGAWRVRKGETG